MAAFAGRALFNCLWLTVACAGDRHSAAFRSPFVLGWYRRLPREIMCQSGRKSGAQLDIHTLVCMCVHRLTRTTNAQTQIWHASMWELAEYIEGCIHLRDMHTQSVHLHVWTQQRSADICEHTCSQHVHICMQVLRHQKYSVLSTCQEIPPCYKVQKHDLIFFIHFNDL